MAPTSTRAASYRAEAFFISLAVLLLEISYTRVVSFKLYYYYTYLVLGLALLGLGAGGVLVAVSQKLRQWSTDKVLALSMGGGSLLVIGTYLAITPIPVNTLSIWTYRWGSLSSIAYLGLICILVFVGFLGPGIALSTLFGRQPERMNSLYFSDLIGAAVACTMVGYLNSHWSPPTTIMLAALLYALSTFRAVRRTYASRLAMWALVPIVALGFVFAGSSLPDQHIDSSKSTYSTPAYTHWSPIFRIDAFPISDNVVLLYHDGLPGSAIYKWNGKLDSLAAYNYDRDIRAFPFVALGTTPQREAVIGAAGGHEVLASLYFGAKKIDAVELNPATYHLVTNEYKTYGGDLAHYPGVNYFNADGRSFISRTSTNYDLVWYPAPDSYSASSASQAGAFVLSESYLYTSNAVEQVYKHLTDNGVFIAQFGEYYRDQPSRTARFVGNVRSALEHLGVNDPASKIVVISTPDTFATPFQTTILVKKSGFSSADVTRLNTLVTSSQFNGWLNWAPGRTVYDNPIKTIVSAPPSTLYNFYNNYVYDVRPVDDNQPYFYHYASFDRVLTNFTDPIQNNNRTREIAVGERVLFLLLGLSVVLAALFLLIPFLKIRDTWRSLPKKRSSALYFAMLGFGFIFFEIILIQLLNLFLGYPTYSLTVSLMSLLVFAGIGALNAHRVNSHRYATQIGVGGIVGLTAFYAFGLRPLTNELLGLPLALRIIVAFVLLAPLGLLLGTFMPRGVAQVAALSEHADSYVAWSWAINGFASVTGSVLATICAMQFGFQTVLIVAMCFYLVALATLPKFRTR